MPGKRSKLYDEFKYKVALEALSGISVALLARQHQVTNRTVYNWVNEYREKFGEEAVPPADRRITEMKRLEEIEDKYNKAIHLLGEKDLQIAILEDLLKKKNPAYRKEYK